MAKVALEVAVEFGAEAAVALLVELPEALRALNVLRLNPPLAYKTLRQRYQRH